MGEYELEIRHLYKRFGPTPAAKDVSLSVKSGEFMILLGPSGCGKTTTLRCIAGLEEPDQGEILMGGSLISSAEKDVFVPPNKRNLGMVFQSYAVWPHMTVFENVSYPLRVKHYQKSETAQRVKEVLALMEIEQYEKTNVTKLSGGEQQRVALARSLVTHPRIVLLDEPLSNLDAKFRKQMRFELKRIQRKVGLTFVYVTHNQDEAMGMGDRIAVMEGGEVQQVGTPLEIYGRPNNLFVAQFVGRKTILSGTVKEVGDGTALLETERGLPIRFSISSGLSTGDRASVFITPGCVSISSIEPLQREGNIWKGEITTLQHLGDVMELEMNVSSHRLLAIVKPSSEFRENQTAFASIDPREICLIGPRVARRALNGESSDR